VDRRHVVTWPHGNVAMCLHPTWYVGHVAFDPMFRCGHVATVTITVIITVATWLIAWFFFKCKLSAWLRHTSSCKFFTDTYKDEKRLFTSIQMFGWAGIRTARVIIVSHIWYIHQEQMLVVLIVVGGPYGIRQACPTRY